MCPLDLEQVQLVFIIWMCVAWSMIRLVGRIRIKKFVNELSIFI